MIRAAPLVAVFALTVSAPATADGWHCTDSIQYTDGWSIMSQLYFDDVPAEVGPLYHLSRGDIYANWYPEPKRLGAPFQPPSLLSFDMRSALISKPSYGIFESAGGTPIRIAVSTFGSKDASGVTRVLFQPKDRQTNGALLKRQDWKISLFDKRGRPSGTGMFRFPFSLSELEQTYWGHVTSIQAKALNKETQCGENTDEAQII